MHNLENMSLEQLKQIRDSAPDGATTHYKDSNYFGLQAPSRTRYWNMRTGECKEGLLDNSFIKLSDIRTEIQNRELRLVQHHAPISRAFVLAEKWHAGQKYGEHNYFLHHILGVADRLTKQDMSHHAVREIIITAYLHDILEDTACPESEVANFGDDVLAAVKAITKQKDESNSDYLHRCKSNEIAKIVKIADARFNRDQNWNDPVRFAYYDAVVNFMKGRTDQIPEKPTGQPVFKVGDRVVCKTGECSVLFVIHSFDSENFEFFYLNVPPCGAPDYREHISKLRHATAEEEIAGHRIDAPVASCGATNADIDYFAEHHSSRPYVELPEFEERALGLNGEQSRILVDQANEIFKLTGQINDFKNKLIQKEKSLRDEAERKQSLWLENTANVFKAALDMLEQALKGEQDV